MQNDKNYHELLSDIKNQIQQARLKTLVSVNAQMIKLYWDIGNMIIQKQEAAGWGAKIIDNLAQDLKSSFPDMKGISPRNLKYMRKFATEYQDFTIVQVRLAQISWYHNIDDFKPEYVGKLNFYLSAVDDLLKQSTDMPSIGLLLCKAKNDVIVEYSLRKMDRPMGVASYQLTKQIPEELKNNLPSEADLKKFLKKKK